MKLLSSSAIACVLGLTLITGCSQQNESKIVEICDSSGCRTSDRLTDKSDPMGEKLAKSQKKAITYRGEDIAELKSQAQNGDAKSAYLLGLVKSQGLAGQKKQSAEAYSYFEQAAEGGMAEAAYQAGAMLMKGVGTKKNTAKGIKMLHLAADGEEPRALFTLGTLFEKGGYVEKNEDEAFRLFSLAEKAGMPEAAYNIGLRYMAGKGVNADPYQAMVYLKKAAERNTVPAQKTLGFLLAQGLEGFPKDLMEARRWLSMVAAKGDKEAKAELKYVQAELDNYDYYNRYYHLERLRLYSNYYSHLYRWRIYRPYYDLYPLGYHYGYHYNRNYVPHYYR